MLQLYPELVKPASTEVPEAISSSSKRWPFFKDCVGALDGTHFSLHCPAAERARFRNRHGELSQNVLAVVDFNMSFTYVLAGWEGTAHDGRVLSNAVDCGFKPPEGKYFLADAGYANKDICLSPYRGVRYYLREWAAAGARLESPQELFNLRHSSLRNVVERTFGVFKRRWRIFDRPHEFDIQTQVKIVYACVAIHNLINLGRGSMDDEYERLPEYSTEELENRRREAQNSEDLQQDNSQMDERRDSIAAAMWEGYIAAQSVAE